MNNTIINVQNMGTTTNKMYRPSSLLQ